MKRSLLTLIPCLLLLLTACKGNQEPSANEPTSSGSTNATDYTIEEGFANVANIDLLEREIPEGKARELLMENGFVVIPRENDEFFPFYEQNRYRMDPNFVTSDSILHTYHLIFDHVLMKTEEEKLLPLAMQITDAMLRASLAQYEEVKGTTWENAGKRNIGFFAIAKKLLDPSYALPDVIRTEAEAELALIAAHTMTADSPLMNLGDTATEQVVTPWGPLTPGALKEDYTQYVPRGHYDRSEPLQKYFRAMMWYGRLTFRFKNPDEVKSALLITSALQEASVRDNWEKLYDITAFFVGQSDDLTYDQLSDIAQDVYENMNVRTLTTEDNKLQEFMKESGTLPAPQINSMPVFRADIEADRTAEIKGFRFMGQRFTLDAAIFQKLLCRDVGTKDGQDLCGGNVPGSRMLPMSLDIAAAMGSNEAYKLLQELGEDDYKYYPENMLKLRSFVEGLDTKTWTQNLYWSWLYTLKPLLEVPGSNHPMFMRNTAWVRKQMQTYFGSWTELKHDTILYAKQAYAELGGGPPPEQDDRGYVEPVPEVYGRLAMLVRMTREGLESRELLPDTQRENLERMEELSEMLREIATKELSGEAITETDYELIRSYGGQIEHLWFEVNREEIEKTNVGTAEYLSENPAAIVADVATDPNGQVLEEATGHVHEIYVLMPVEGKLKLLSGTVFSYYEFPWPSNDRLTDKKWREMLRSDDPTLPDAPAWTDMFLTPAPASPF